MILELRDYDDFFFAGFKTGDFEMGFLWCFMSSQTKLPFNVV